MVDKNKDESPTNIPEDPSALLETLAAQGDERLKAIEVAYRQLDMAQTDEDKSAAIANIGRMLGVTEQFRVEYPKVIPDDEA